MQNYLNLMKKVMKKGEKRPDRTKTGTKSLFGETLRFDLTTGFPIVTTKKIHFKGVVAELLWFLEGSTDERRLCEILYGTTDIEKTTIWTQNANSHDWIHSQYFKSMMKVIGNEKETYNSYVGKTYGYQWRYGMGDQIKKLIIDIKNNPYSRRHMLSAWNPKEIEEMCLPPCHFNAQFYVHTDGYISCCVSQRSCDLFLGVPYNISSYSLLLHIIAQQTDLIPKNLIWNGGDLHLYDNHREQAFEQLSRKSYVLPKLIMSKEKKKLYEISIIPAKTVCCEYTIDDFALEGYLHHPAIKAEMAV